MKLLSFKINDKPSFGLLEDKCVIDLSDYFGSKINTLKKALNLLPFTFDYAKLQKTKK